MTISIKSIAAATFACVLGIANAAQAAPVTFLFGGQVTQSALTGSADVGDTLSGSFTFEDTATDFNPDPNVGSYVDAVTDLNFSVGDFSVSGTGNGIVVGNDCCGSGDGVDLFHMFASNPGAGLGPTVGGLEPAFFRILIIDVFTNVGPASPFTSDALPTTVPNLSDFFIKTFTFRVFNEDTMQFAAVTGVIDTLTAGGVPAPAASALLVAGLAALGLRRRKTH